MRSRPISVLAALVPAMLPINGAVADLPDDTTYNNIYTALDVPEAAPSHRTSAYGIDGDNVVGWFWDGQGSYGFLYDGTTYTSLRPPGAGHTRAFGVDGNRVVGEFQDDDGDHGFLLQRVPIVSGDMNRDGYVGADDLTILINNWNGFVAQGDLAHGDLTGDGYVGADDLAWMIDAWNTGTLPVAATAVPEPTSMAWLAVLLVAVQARRSRCCTR